MAQGFHIGFLIALMTFSSLPSSAFATADDEQPVETRNFSIYNLGVEAYKRKDYAAAAAHWREAITQGHNAALNNLGYLTYYGLGMPASPADGVELWRKGAELGVSEAQWHLGIAYQDGKGVTQDLLQAYGWVRCSIDSATRSAAETNDSSRVETEQTIANNARETLLEITDAMPAPMLITARQRDLPCASGS
ncbi:tetratricopeptide repeat protein [Pseudomonas fulva]|uniref:Sel1 repeat family protein n=1 Tax=Pseudomonas fulva (strain 12-X) TaxID=743720 RepID=F6AHZ3_PSEF1|nr:tetratricopeptide repeat protein [Pseudomonas fulva]AEF22749.1 hypothetical protein Psefu_2785 [Pseudomonas fulva 12-X]